ncbi:MAG TPA: L-threonylcarbamoyladenylate synthase [Nitrososphaeraceae archaeon]|jgi:L-threonylcarbamoyladenylate synthase|nr:L-threonylcarbamoyladenylate synthase [Nitrososphaeraceae archaeon]
MLKLDCKNKDHLIKCKEIIINGGTIVYPTDTIYGLGCDPYNKKAVEKVFKIKKRLMDKPLPILTFDIRSVEKIISLGVIGRKLADYFWPGPLTLIGNLNDNKIPKILTSGKKTVGIRIPNNINTLNLLKYCNFLAGTSANISNENSCLTAKEVMNSKLDGYDAILIGDDNKPKDPFSFKGSTIVDISTNNLQIIRHGIIKSETIYEILHQSK